MRGWEYTTVSDWEAKSFRTPRATTAEQMAEFLNHYGANGWELVTATKPDVRGRDGWHFIFKRPAKEPESPRHDAA